MSLAPEEHGYRAMAFGVRWQSNLQLEPFADDPDAAQPAEITVTFHDAAVPERGFHGQRHNVQYAGDGFRFEVEGAAVFDAFDGCRVEVYPGPRWRGALPMAMFTTVAALLLAGRGCLPMHGSAVVEDAVASMICGPAGAGKSTTAARLIAQGARLISDDLTVLHTGVGGGPPTVSAGRRGMRLYPSAAEALGEAVEFLAPPEPAQHKVVAFPPRVEPSRAFPLGRIVLLGEPAGPIAEELRGAAVANHFFRRSLLGHTPGHKVRFAQLAIAVRSLEVVGEPVL